MRTLATKQPSNSDSAHQKPVRVASAPVMQSHSVSPLSSGMPLLQRKCACGGGCPRCLAEQDLEEALPIQSKLKISQPGDKYEQEADRVAEQVMRMPKPKIQRVYPECEEELQRQPKEEETLQTKPLAEQSTLLMQKQAETPVEEALLPTRLLIQRRGNGGEGDSAIASPVGWVEPINMFEKTYRFDGVSETQHQISLLREVLKL